jgi:hypothetical protein
VDGELGRQYHARVLAHSIHPYLRRLAVAVVLVAYALPLSLGAVSELSHEVSHLVERLEESRARAAALGMVHLGEGFTHTHDGVTHAHAGAVDALLSASEHTDEDTDAAAPVVKLSTHTPAPLVRTWVAIATARAFAAVDAVAPDHPRPLPPLPPPRG